jgi:hypothetical protein
MVQDLSKSTIPKFSLSILAAAWNREVDTPLASAEGILNSATDLKMFCPCGNS